MSELYEPTGAIIDAIGQPSFPQKLVDACQHIAPFDYSVTFGYSGSARPIDIHDTFPAAKKRVFVEDYQEGPYLLDPFYLAATKPVTSGLYRMRELAPDRFYQGEYFRSYYVQTGLEEEIGYFVAVPGDAMIVVSLMRAKKAFTAKEIRELKSYWPIISSACRANWADFAKVFKEQDYLGREDKRIHESVEKAFMKIGGGLLTPREREVVEHTLKGHSADAVGKILGISSGTVRIHRRNVYAKLRIGNQGKLFSHFIDTLMEI